MVNRLFGTSFHLRQHLIQLIALSFFLLGPGPASADPCVVDEGPPGTITLPPDDCGYLSPEDVHMIIDGLPIGTTIEIGIEHKAFFCGGQGVEDPPCSVAIPSGFCEAPGGSLAGTVDCFFSEAELTMTGTGDLDGFSRTITIPLTTEVHAGPRTPGAPVQDFPTEMVQLQGSISGDPDFDFLQIEAGSNFGLPSSGQTTLTDLGGGKYHVDSFFDIVYEITYIGNPGGALMGVSDTTQGSVRMAVESEVIPALSEPGWLLLGALVIGTSALALHRRRVTG